MLEGFTRKMVIALACLAFLVGAVPAVAGDIYIAQIAQGVNDGQDCADAYAVSFFNNPANWGTAAGKIGPGTTVKLCGVFTFAAGSNGLMVQGSGANGNPVTILFESGAILQAPYFLGFPGGGIVIDTFNYITVDGGTNGIIQNTANGTNLANRQTSSGMFVRNTTGVEIKNLTIRNIYVHVGSQPTDSDSNGQLTSDIELEGNQTNLNIHNNKLTAARMGINSDFGGTTVNGLTISNNTISDHCFMMSLGFGSATTAARVSVHDNDMSNWDNWQFPGNTFHQDGIITHITGNNPNTYAPNIYNNYFHTNLGNGNATAFLFLANDTSGQPVHFQANVFNNVFMSDLHKTNTSSVGVGINAIWIQGTTGPHFIYNNTFSAPLASTAAIVNADGGAVTLTLKNNIFIGYANAMACYNLCQNDVPVADYNLYFRMALSGGQIIANNIGAGTGPWYSFTQWQAKGYDTHGVTADPALDTTGYPQVGSAAAGA